jgi:ESS family glutamate:Na+ symporter
MNQPWDVILELGYISLAILVAVGLRRLLPFLKKFRIPDAIVAGFLAMVVGPSILGWIPFDSARLTALVYHLMAIGFIALALKRSEAKGRGRSAVSGSFYIVVSYGIQGFIGLAITIILIKTLYPNLFPSFGFLLPFGFAQGPGLAGGMAAEWATKVSPAGIKAFPSVTTATSVGFSFSTIGFLWACIIGVPLMNVLVRRRKRLGEPEPGLTSPPSRFMIEKEREYSGLARSIDKTTTQLMLIGIIYLGLYFGLKGMTWGLTKIIPGNLGANMASMFWGFQFGFGALLGTFAGKFIRWLETKGLLKGKATNDYQLQHIGGMAIDFMIVCSIAAIDIRVLGQFIVPILIITTIGGVTVMSYTWFFARRVWRKTYVEHFVALFGMHTGTIATGMALLRGVDPQFRTSAASDMIYGSGIALILGIPLIFLAGLPATGFETGNHNLYWITLLLMLGYGAVILAIWFNPWAFKFFTRHSRGEASKG